MVVAGQCRQSDRQSAPLRPLGVVLRLPLQFRQLSCADEQSNWRRMLGKIAKRAFRNRLRPTNADTLSLHDALPISDGYRAAHGRVVSDQCREVSAC